MADKSFQVKCAGKISLVLACTFIVLFTTALSFLAGAWRDYPSGTDIFFHLTRIKYVLSYWPNDRLMFLWSGGLPNFLFYPPLPYYLIAAFSKISTLSVELSINIALLVSLVIVSFGVYGTVSEVTGDWRPALLAALLAVSTPSLWHWWIVSGAVIRIVGLSFLSLSMYSTLRFVRNSTRQSFFFAVIFTSLVLQSHLADAAVALPTIFVIVALCAKAWQKVTSLVKIVVPSFLLSAYFYVPFFYNQPVGHFFAGGETFGDRPTILWLILPIGKDYLHTYRGLSPLLLPLALGLLIVQQRGRGFQGSEFSKKTLVSLGIVSFALGLFSLSADLGIPPSYYPMGLYPQDSIFFLPVFLAAICGILLGQVLHKIKTCCRFPGYRVSHRRRTVLASILCATFVWSLVKYPLTSDSFRAYQRPHSEDSLVFDLLNQHPSDENHRFGAFTGVGPWFNYRYPIPQTHGYYGQETPPEYKGWITWLDHAIRDEARNPLESQFLLDWYAVRKFITDQNTGKFLSRPEDYEAVVASEGTIGFVYKHAGHLISATSAPSALIIGSNDASYAPILHSFALSGYDSRFVIPVRGFEYVDRYASEDLKLFDVVILFGYNYRDRSRAFEALERYVKDGGNLIVDTGYSLVPTSDLPVPFPMSKARTIAQDLRWHFTSLNTPMTSGINFTSFSPAIYDNGPWAVSVADNETVQPWAQVILWNRGHPVVVAGRYGKGNVVWLGLNLPTHINTYHNIEESKFLSKIIDWATGRVERRIVRANYSVSRSNPEEAQVTIMNSSSGVLFKESYFKNWCAYLVDIAGRRFDLPIFRAGPDFMYVRLPTSQNFPVKVLFQYLRSWEESLGYMLSAIAMVALCGYGLAPTLFKRLRYPYSHFAKVKNRLSEWWTKEEKKKHPVSIERPQRSSVDSRGA